MNCMLGCHSRKNSYYKMAEKNQWVSLGVIISPLLIEGLHVTPNHLRRGLNLQLKALTQTTRWPDALVMLQRARTAMGLDVVSWTTVMRACARGKAWRFVGGGMEQTMA